MAVLLAITYQKKLGLPNYSSHSCSVSLTVEIPDVSVAAQESTKLYALLQTAVDNEIQAVGFMPDGSTYGMKPSQNGNGQTSNGNCHERPPAQNRNNGEAWACTDGQKSFLQRIINDNKLNKNDVEAMAQDLFGVGVKACNKMQMSQLIEDLLEKTGRKTGGNRRWSRQPART
jgi:hypothetical protein